MIESILLTTVKIRTFADNGRLPEKIVHRGISGVPAVIVGSAETSDLARRQEPYVRKRTFGKSQSSYVGDLRGKYHVHQR